MNTLLPELKKYLVTFIAGKALASLRVVNKEFYFLTICGRKLDRLSIVAQHVIEQKNYLVLSIGQNIIVNLMLNKETKVVQNVSGYDIIIASASAGIVMKLIKHSDHYELIPTDIRCRISIIKYEPLIKLENTGSASISNLAAKRVIEMILKHMETVCKIERLKVLQFDNK
jgi:hypothetical protein